MYLYNMSENTEILLGSVANVDSVNVDNYQKLELENKTGQILEYDIRNALSATEVFDAERNAYEIYRIYGRIEYMSLLNGLKLNYIKLEDFFLPQKTNNKNIFNSFDFYLLKAGTGYTRTTGGTSTIDNVRYFDVIATPSEFELYNAGYTNNVYGEQVYAFNFNTDFDVAPYVDDFGFPLMELFLYAQYKPGKNALNQAETMLRTSWGANNTITKVPFTPTALNIGDRIYGDLIEYAKTEFLQFQLMPQTYYINTIYDAGTLQWKYNPFISFPLRYFYDNLSNANTGSTSYAQQSTIPYYATLLTGGTVGTGNYVWKEIIPQGNVDPLTGLGVDYPFVNKKRYLFSPIILDVSPNLNDSFTLNAFNQIKFGIPIPLNTKPNSDLNNIGKPCL
jgi:hypothetical protein